MLSRARAVWRLLRAVAHMLRGLLIIFVQFPRLSPQQREIRIQAWSSGMLSRVGVRLVVQGTPVPQGPLLLVSNHISWLDITALHAARFCRFVSKADVKAWPLIGALASGIGTLFIQRESRRDAMRVVHHMAQSLRDGDVLAVFPEGTTSDGVDLLPFHGNLLQAAISADAPVQPIALQFVDTRTGRLSVAPSYAGDDTLMVSVWRTLCTSGIMVQITFGEPQKANGRDRRDWAADLQAEITQMRKSAVRG